MNSSLHLQHTSHNLFEIEHFLSAHQCIESINYAESMGFEAADVSLTVNKRAYRPDLRNNDRLNDYSTERAKLWWDKLSTLPLPMYEGSTPCACSPYFRFYKYSPGQKFAMHKDGSQSINGNTTLFTLIVYLNSEYTGGRTQFRQDDITITPKTGNALLFEHHLWHKSTALLTGCKYVIRTDIVYELDNATLRRDTLY